MSDRTPVPEYARTTEPSITEPQANFIRGLLEERDLSKTPTDQIERLRREVEDGALTKKKAGEIITWLLGKDKKPVQAQSLPEVPAGRYAIENLDGELRFYVVDKPTQGKWKGYTFLSVMASDEKHPIKGPVKTAILEKIAEDPKAAMQRYGFEIGRCGICGRTLTNEVSRRLGIGPVCAGAQGWL